MSCVIQQAYSPLNHPTVKATHSFLYFKEFKFVTCIHSFVFFCPRIYLAFSWKHFLCLQWGQEFHWHLLGATEHPAVCRAALTPVTI